MKTFDEHDDDLLRRVSLKLDGRLDAAALAQLGRDLESAPNGRALESSLSKMRSDLLAVPLPKHSDALLSRTLTRVAAARAARDRDVRILPFLRAFAAVAALILVANVLYLKDTVSAADNVKREISVEDEFRRAENLGPTQDDQGLSRYLGWYFLRRNG